MHVPPVLAALPLLALRASAFLIPPTPDNLDLAVVEEQENVWTKSILAGLPQIVALDCPGCSFEGRQDVENKIHLRIEASLTRGLVINGVSVLPSAFDTPSPVSISAFQMSSEDGQTTAEQPLDFALERLEPMTSAQEEGAMIIPVRFTVLAIGGEPVKTDTVAVHLLRNEEELILLRSDLIPFEETPGAEDCPEQGWSLCRIKAIIIARVRSMMQKMMKHKDAAKGWVKNGCEGRFTGMGGPEGFGWMGGRQPGEFGHHHHHHHGHRHWRAHRFGKVLHKTLRFFVIPALLGVIGGLMASAVGMLVGQILVFLWQNFYRRGQRGQPSPRVIEIVVREGEKVALMDDEDDEDAPPLYEDVEAVVGEEKQ